MRILYGLNVSVLIKTEATFRSVILYPPSAYNSVTIITACIEGGYLAVSESNAHRGAMQNNTSEDKHHSISITDRAHMEISGVVDVLSFDDSSVSLVTELGSLEIDGEGLHISVLDPEKKKMVLDGKANSVYYISDAVKKDGSGKGFFSRLMG